MRWVVSAGGGIGIGIGVGASASAPQGRRAQMRCKAPQALAGMHSVLTCSRASSSPTSCSVLAFFSGGADMVSLKRAGAEIAAAAGDAARSQVAMKLESIESNPSYPAVCKAVH